jgi:hypothetical protein
MKRAFFEWSAMGISALAIACFGYWAASKTTTVADSRMAWRFLDVSLADGSVTLAGLEAVEKSLSFLPKDVNLPGFELRFATTAGGNRLGWIKFSLLIPAFMLMLCAAYPIYKYRKRKNAAAFGEKPAASSEPAVHPLD